jgi:hypothetical protein
MVLKMELNNSELMMMVISLKESIKLEETKLYDAQMKNPDEDSTCAYKETIEETMCNQYIEELKTLLNKLNTKMNEI